MLQAREHHVGQSVKQVHRYSSILKCTVLLPFKSHTLKLDINHCKLQLVSTELIQCFWFHTEGPVQHLAAMVFFYLDNSLP